MLVVGLMQVGVRFYTRRWIAAGCVEACAEAGRPVVVLDCPNPLGGMAVEGTLLAREHRSIHPRRRARTLRACWKDPTRRRAPHAALPLPPHFAPLMQCSVATGAAVTCLRRHSK